MTIFFIKLLCYRANTAFGFSVAYLSETKPYLKRASYRLPDLVSSRKCWDYIIIWKENSFGEQPFL